MMIDKDIKAYNLVKVSWPMEKFECVIGACADLFDELVCISEEPTYVTAQKHSINGDDKHMMFECHLYYMFDKDKEQHFNNVKAFFQVYKKENIGVEVEYS